MKLYPLLQLNGFDIVKREFFIMIFNESTSVNVPQSLSKIKMIFCWVIYLFKFSYVYPRNSERIISFHCSFFPRNVHYKTF